METFVLKCTFCNAANLFCLYNNLFSIFSFFSWNFRIPEALMHFSVMPALKSGWEMTVPPVYSVVYIDIYTLLQTIFFFKIILITLQVEKLNYIR
jgi:hypothetical protein